MTPKRTNHSEGRLFQSRLSEILDPTNKLLLLADLTDWKSLESSLSSYFKSDRGAAAKPVRLVAGIFMLQHMSGLSDEQVMIGWVQNPYWQYFCGYDYLQWTFPLDPSSLSRWRKRLGKEGLEKILQATLRVALDLKIVKEDSFASVIVDTTVMVKNITYPTDAKLYYKGIQLLVKEAKSEGLKLRQTYTFLSKKALRKAHQYAHARQMKRAKKEIKRLHTYLGRVHRDIHRQVESEVKKRLLPLLKITEKILLQKKQDKDKIYSLHEPAVECIAKGKAHKKYEFSCKASLVLTHKEGIALCVNAHHGKPYDGHTLQACLEQAEKLTGKTIKRGFVDKGYRGHKVQEAEIYITGRRGLTRHYKKLLNRRQAIEPHIGHMKSEGKLGCNYLKGRLGDHLNAVLCAIGHNLRMILRRMDPHPV